MEKLKNVLEKSIQIVSVILFAWIIFLLIFCENFVKYACKKEFIISNICILVFFIGLILLYRIKLRKRYILISNLKYRKIVNICTIIFWGIQIYICYNIFFVTGWDSGSYIVPAAQSLAGNSDLTIFHDYFAKYPNNLLMINIYSLILKLNSVAGVFADRYELMSIIICNCAISSLTCFLIFTIGSRMVKEKYAFIGYMISLILIGMSPWMVICYSDSFVLFVLILIINIYMNDKIQHTLKYVLIFVMGYLGYCIKPQVIIVVIAIIIVEAIKRFGKKDIKVLKMDAIAICISSILIVILASSLHGVYEREGFEINSEKKMGMTHFFMMGLNPNQLGVWSGEDVELSSDCKNQNERTKTNIEISKDRLKNYGMTGYLKLLSKKMLTNYNDGTFAWGTEGTFYASVPEDINTFVSGKLKELFYDNGSYFWFFSSVEQCLWILVILFNGLESVFVLGDKSRERDYEYLVMILSIIGLTVFELLFEARARYLYIYVPVYILIALYGIRDMDDRIKSKGEIKDEEAYPIYCNTML